MPYEGPPQVQVERALAQPFRVPVDVINGLIAQEGRKRGIATPANAALVEVTRRIYVGELKPDPGNLKLAIELAGAADLTSR